MNDLLSETPPLSRPDNLAGAVLISLSRPLNNLFSWSLVRTVVLGALSFGILPLFALSKRLRHSCALERSQLWHLAEWMRTNCGEETAPLVQSAEEIRVRPILKVLPPLCGFAALFVLGFTIIHYEPSFAQLIDATYGYIPAFANSSTPRFAQNLFGFWTITLGIGYTSLWLAMQIQQNAVRRFVRTFSLFATREGAAATPTPPLSLGLRPLWVIGGFLLASGGAVWAIPMMLAGAAQRRYTKRIGVVTRTQLAQRVREIMQTRQPEKAVPMPASLLRSCRGDRCAAKLPPGAKFCPRCGAPCSIAMVA